MRKFYILSFLLYVSSAVSQINSPNGNNIFYYNGLADVYFAFPERGPGGRAFVHSAGNVLSLNYESDFAGGTRIGNDVFFKDGGNSYVGSGNFGIGTSQSTSNLSIGTNHGIKLSVGNLSWANTAIIQTGFNDAVGDFADFKVPGHGGNDAYIKIIQNGNVGIGTKIPDSKLAVNGTIHSKEVKVDMTGWSDFVFKKEYSLPTLEQVEKHIAEKGHLENIPSEEEVMKNGISLGEMNSRLLQKIEELTLYVIEQDKKTEKLKAIIKGQNKRLEKLENKR